MEVLAVLARSCASYRVSALLKASGFCPSHRFWKRFESQSDLHDSLVVLDRKADGLPFRAEHAADGLQFRRQCFFAIDASQYVVRLNAGFRCQTVLIDGINHDSAVLSEEMKAAQVPYLGLINACSSSSKADDQGNRTSRYSASGMHSQDAALGRRTSATPVEFEVFVPETAQFECG